MKDIMKHYKKLMNSSIPKIPKEPKSLRNMSYTQALKKHGLRPLGDFDGDGIQNFLDCRPLNKLMQDLTPLPAKKNMHVAYYYDPKKQARGEFPYGVTHFDVRKPAVKRGGAEKNVRDKDRTKRGNRKLDESTIIYNPYGTSFQCMSADRGLCPIVARGDDCYDRDTEWRHGANVSKYRGKQRTQWQEVRSNGVIKIQDFIDWTVKENREGRTIKRIRISEGSDIKDQKDIDLLSEWARGVQGEGITMYGYTKCTKDVKTGKELDLSNVPSNFVLNFGAGRKRKGHNIFAPVSKEFIERKMEKGLDPEREAVCVAGVHKCMEGECEAGGGIVCSDRKDVVVYTPYRPRGTKAEKERQWFEGLREKLRRKKQEEKQ